MRVTFDTVVQGRPGQLLDLRPRRQMPAAALPRRQSAVPAAPAVPLTPNATTYPADTLLRQQATANAQALRRSLPWWRVLIALVVVLAVSDGFAYQYNQTTARLHPAVAAQAKAVAAPAKATSASPAVAGPTSPQLQAIVNQAAASAGVPTGIVTIDLANGATATSGGDTVFTSASIYKLYVADAIYQELDSGQLSTSAAAGATGFNVNQCLYYMITISSNPCGEALGGIVGWSDQNAALHAAGFTGTTLSLASNEQTTASDTALLLQKLYKGTLLNPSGSAAFIGLLKAQQINNRLPAGLPAGTAIAHKTGDLNGLVHDAGIVYTPHGNYIVVALTGPWADPSTAPPWFANLSSQLYAAVTK